MPPSSNESFTRFIYLYRHLNIQWVPCNIFILIIIILSFPLVHVFSFLNPVCHKTKLPGKPCMSEWLLQSWPKYMRQTLVLVWKSALQEKFNFSFWTVFHFYWKNCHFVSLNPLSNSWCNSYIPCLLLIITIPFTCGKKKKKKKKKLVKHQKVSKYYGQDCLKNFLLHFMSSLRAPISENSHFVAGIYFIFLKTRLKSNFKCFQ